MRAVDDARVALQAVPRSTDDFRTRLVLRSELLEERGNALQAVVGEQANPVAREFCLRRGLRQSASFAPGAYGPDASSVMARSPTTLWEAMKSPTTLWKLTGGQQSFASWLRRLAGHCSGASGRSEVFLCPREDATEPL